MTRRDWYGRLACGACAVVAFAAFAYIGWSVALGLAGER